jgi:hypothetical protein
VVGVVGVVGVGGVGVGGWGVVSPCVRTFQGLHSVRLWTPPIYKKRLIFLIIMLMESHNFLFKLVFLNNIFKKMFFSIHC